MMKKSVIIIGLLLVAGCSSVTPDANLTQDVTIIDSNKNHLSDPAVTQSILTKQLKQWQGVPYKNGGMTRKGVDCSGFVYLTYLNQFGLAIPRTTQFQSEIGTSVSRSRLQAGDLVFFKTGFKVRHVGIYLANNQFVHASTSKGVMVSSLNGNYWKEKYWQARRIED